MWIEVFSVGIFLRIEWGCSHLLCGNFPTYWVGILPLIEWEFSHLLAVGQDYVVTFVINICRLCFGILWGRIRIPSRVLLLGLLYWIVLQIVYLVFRELKTKIITSETSDYASRSNNQGISLARGIWWSTKDIARGIWWSPKISLGVTDYPPKISLGVSIILQRYR